MAVQSGASFGLFMGIGAFIRCDDGLPTLSDEEASDWKGRHAIRGGHHLQSNRIFSLVQRQNRDSLPNFNQY